uniref:Uncharacterized protein n=1 Tax=Arundo donax TaxID=35708 RepID=A0A0A9BI50_ARUDO
MQRRYEPVRVGELSGGDDLLRRRLPFFAVGDVGANGVVEQDGFLAYQPHLPPQPADLEVLDVHTVLRDHT